MAARKDILDRKGAPCQECGGPEATETTLREVAVAGPRSDATTLGNYKAADKA